MRERGQIRSRSNRRKLFEKYCSDCNKKFRPTGRGCKYCNECKKERLTKWRRVKFPLIN